MELSDENIGKIKGLILFAAVTAVCFWQYPVTLSVLAFVWRIALPFALGGGIAFILNVPVDFLEKRLLENVRVFGRRLPEKTARLMGLAFVLAAGASVLAVVLLQLAPRLGTVFSTLGSKVGELAAGIRRTLDQRFAGNLFVEQIFSYAEESWQEWIGGFSFFGSDAGQMLDSTLTAAKQLISAAATFFIAVAFGIYILLQKENLKRQTKKVLYAFVRKGRADAVVEVLALTYQTFSRFLAGQCIEAVILGGMFVVSLLAFGFPYAFLIGVTIMVTALIPIFGSFVGCAAGGFLIFLTAPEKVIGFFVLFLVLQQIEGNFIYPHVVGNSVGLPAIWVLAAVSIGGNLMGVVGMLVFIPIFSVLYALFREIVYLKLKKAQIRAEDLS